MKLRHRGDEPTGRRGHQATDERIDQAGNADGGQGSEYVDTPGAPAGAAERHDTEQTDAERSAWWRAHHWTPPAG